MPSVKFDEKQISSFVKTFKAFEVPTTNEYMSHFFKTKGASVSIYKSGKVVFQGSSLSMFKEYMGSADLSTKENKGDKKETFFPYDSYNTIGSDEVGTGDVFGPVVVATAFVMKKDVDYLKTIGVTDSKKIKDDKIISLAEILLKKIKNIVLVVRCEKFNDEEKKYNLNQMKAMLHNQNIKEMASIVKYDYVCLDQFAEKNKYFSYLGKDAFKNINFETKGEVKSIAVAAASIIARYYFLNEMERLKVLYGYPLPKGAGKDADLLIKKIREEEKAELFYHIAKMNYKNFKK